MKYITVSKFKKCISSDIRVWVKNGGEDGKKRTRYIPTESFHEATEITFLTEITFFTRDDLDLNSEKTVANIKTICAMEIATIF